MKTLLYDELVSFYHLLDPLEDHADEGEAFGAVLRAAVPDGKRLLELGSGAGHGAFYIKRAFEHVTLCDLSPPMLARSLVLNPECEHVEADMRTARLGSNFDCVLIHDAICYLTTREDLRATAATVFAHLRPGGAALLIPDCVKETFKESHEDHAGDDRDRGLRCISWSYDPDPDDDVHLVDFAFLLREQGKVRAVHDRHECGLFTTDVWLEVYRQARFDVEVIARPLSDDELDAGYTQNMFLCRKR